MLLLKYELSHIPRREMEMCNHLAVQLQW